jgi:hypothetical protein
MTQEDLIYVRRHLTVYLLNRNSVLISQFIHSFSVRRNALILLRKIFVICSKNNTKHKNARFIQNCRVFPCQSTLYTVESALRRLTEHSDSFMLFGATRQKIFSKWRPAGLRGWMFYLCDSEGNWQVPWGLMNLSKLNCRDKFVDIYCAEEFPFMFASFTERSHVSMATDLFKRIQQIVTGRENIFTKRL